MLSEEARKRYAPQLRQLERALVLWRRDEPVRGHGSTTSQRHRLLLCGCEPPRKIRASRAALAGPENAAAGPGQWETRWRCAYYGQVLTAWPWPAPPEQEQRRVAESDIVEHLRQARACRGKQAALRRGSSLRPVAVAVVVREGRVLLVRRRVQEAGFS